MTVIHKKGESIFGSRDSLVKHGYSLGQHVYLKKEQKKKKEYQIIDTVCCIKRDKKAIKESEEGGKEEVVKSSTLCSAVLDRIRRIDQNCGQGSETV